MKIKMIQTALMILAATLGGAVSPVAAQEARVIVPSAPGGASFLGCYRANETLFGRHRLTFCLDRRGTYRITGAAQCNGQLTWRVVGRTISIDLHRALCGRGRAWERATMSCSSTGRLLPAAANLPQVSRLRCTYRPTVRGQRFTTFTADRTRF